MALFIIGLIILIAGLGYSLFVSIQTIKNKVMQPIYKTLYTKLLISGGVYVLGLLLFLSGIHLWKDLGAGAFEWSFSLIFGFLFGVSSFGFIHGFLLHYYSKTIDEKNQKLLFIITMVCIPVVLISFLYATNGYADYLEYPLYKVLNFNEGFIRGNEPNPSGLNLTFYALFILSGAVFVYLLSDHKMYLEYGRHGILESTFLVAFPAGILGARIFYVLGELGHFIEIGFWQHAFNFTEGGLTILGGAVTGVVVGVLWFRWRNKGLNVLIAADIVVPAILIAQSVGRWGNFFNLEVYGYPVSVSSFSFLPKFITSNMIYPAYTDADLGGYISLEAGQMWMPLFFIEGLINLFGYFLLAHVFGKALRKYTELGDLTFGYIVWYGLTRVLLEPLRVKEYKMGTWSWYWSFAFVIVGILLIALNHLIRIELRKKNNTLVVRKYYEKLGLTSSISVIVVGLILSIVGIIMMANNSFEAKVVFDGFNIGLMLLMLGLAFFSALLLTLPYYIVGKKHVQKI